jgi:tRNA 2-thiouridine synthesizing protein B
MDYSEQLLLDTKESRVDIFLLTKPPCSDRARFCLQLIKRSENAVLYLAGDGVYNLLEKALEALPLDEVLACREDLEARGVQAGDKTTVPVDFYEQLVDDAMNESSRIYTF